MDRDCGGEPGDQERYELDKAGVAGAGGRHDAAVQGREDDDEATEVARVRDKRQRVRISLTPRRVRIDPRKKRRLYIKRLERLMQECDQIISDPEGFEEIQVKAMSILIRAIKVCYVLVTDEQVETLEEELEKLKRRIAEKIRAGKPEA